MTKPYEVFNSVLDTFKLKQSPSSILSPIKLIGDGIIMRRVEDICRG
jgi:hypothetical protein